MSFITPSKMCMYTCKYVIGSGSYIRDNNDSYRTVKEAHNDAMKSINNDILIVQDEGARSQLDTLKYVKQDVSLPIQESLLGIGPSGILPGLIEPPRMAQITQAKIANGNKEMEPKNDEINYKKKFREMFVNETTKIMDNIKNKNYKGGKIKAGGGLIEI